MHLSPELLRFARRHNGLVTLASWTAGGLSARSFHRAEGAGLLVPLAPSVAALAGTPIGPVQRIHAEVLAARQRAVASHRSAALLWGAAVVGDRPVDLVTTSGPRVRRPNVVVHRARDGRGLHAVVRHQVPVASPMRTLIDLGAVDAEAVPATLECFLIAGLVGVPAVRVALAAQRRSGRRGVKALATALADLPLGAKIPDSTLEPRMASLFARFAITDWVFHAVVSGYEVDFAFLDAEVVVEVDGFGFHADRAAFERDRERDTTIAAAGWVVLRFTWRQVTRRPAFVGDRVRATLARRRRERGALVGRKRT